jgi:hypothetical protein
MNSLRSNFWIPIVETPTDANVNGAKVVADLLKASPKPERPIMAEEG